MSNDFGNNKDNPFEEKAIDSPFVSSGGYSLESIITEIKGSEYLEEDMRTPVSLLEAEAERILREASLTPEPDEPDEELKAAFALREEPEAAPVRNESAPAAPAAPAAPVVEDMPYIEPEAPPEEFDPDVINAKPEIQELNEPSAAKSAADFGDTIRIPETGPSVQSGNEPAAKPPGPAFMPETPESAADRLISEAYDKYDKPDYLGIYDEPEFSNTNDIPLVVTPPEETASRTEPETYTSNASSSFTVSIDGASFERPTDLKPARPVHTGDFESIDIPIDDNTGNKKSARIVRQIPSFVTEDDYIDEGSEDEYFEEPRLKDQAVRFARVCNSISRRIMPAALITVLMILITIVFEAGMQVPYGIGQNLEAAAGTLVLLLLIVMMLCIEIIIRGAEYLIHGVPNAETLVFLSCVFSLVSALFTIFSGTALMLPFCAVSAVSLVLSQYGERTMYRAMTDSIKIAISTPEPYGVQAEFNDSLESSVLKKAYNRTDGFYSNLVGADITEILYKYASPILLIVVLIITVFNVMIHRVVENSLHIFSALLASAAPFSLLLTYSFPFSIITRSLKNSGAALAGWGGADDIAHTDGVCITDDDLFPAGTLRLSGVKIFDGAAPNNVLCYTASLIIASGSGLTGLFAEVLAEKGITPLRVANFECHESGISGIVHGHQIATGSAGYMNLIGVRVPDDSNLRNAVFTAVNNRLVAMFTIEYKPLPVVQSALISMLKWRIDLFFAMRDFNITPSMVGQKFKVPFDSFVFMSVSESYSISDPYSGRHGRMSAVLVRESLGPYASAITAARLLRSASFFATVLSIASAVFGVFIMCIMLWDGSFDSATPGNLMLYMFYMLIAVIIVCGYVKIRK